MKKAIAQVTALIFLFIGAAFGQVTSSTSAGANNSVDLKPGTRIDGRLQGAVDVKKAKVGDKVVLKTAKAIKENGKTVVPKGALLIGRVTDVQQKTRANGMSSLGMVFDRIESKSLSTPINASIVSILNARGSVADQADADLLSSSGVSARPAGNNPGGGSLLGGVTNTVGGVVNTTTSSVGTIADNTGRTVGTVAGSAGRTVTGIQIANGTSLSAASGSTLTAADRNIRLEQGSTVQLQLKGMSETE